LKIHIIQHDGSVVMGLMFHCPACGCAHGININGGKVVGLDANHPPQWTWNGNCETPTFLPSILVTWFEGPQNIPHKCHSFVRDGKIQFLGDCTHKLSGQTVDLPDWEGFSK
jgi:hypothetical protein